MQDQLNKIPILSANMIRGLSQQRRASLANEIKLGKFGEQNARAHGFRHGMDEIGSGASPLGFAVTASSSNYSNSSGGGWQGAGDTTTVGPDIYSPLWLTGNLSLPRDRATVNAWSRAFFALNPIVQNAISLHSTYPISKLNIRCKDPKVEQFFEEMNEDLDLINVCSAIAQEYWILGECFPYAQLDQSTGKWSKILIHNPDYINVQQSNISEEPVISLRPDEQLKKIVNSNDSYSRMTREKMGEDVIQAIKRGNNIVLSNFNVTHLARRISPYEVRGTGLITPCFRALMHFDIIRESELVQNQAMINPWLLVKVGSAASEHKVSPEALQSFREKLEQATFNKDFKLITHDQVEIQNISRSAGILDTTARIQELKLEIMCGLHIPSIAIDGSGSDITYQNGGIALDVLKQRYLQFRVKLANFLKKKIFNPIAELHEMYEYKSGKKMLISPEISWNHMSLFDTDSNITTLKELSSPERTQVSVQTLYRAMGLDFEDEQRKIRQEAIESAIHKKESESLSHMSLAELRTLDESKEIPEPKQTMGEQEPGEEGAMPEMGGEMPGGEDLGGLPGVPAPPPGTPAP